MQTGKFLVTGFSGAGKSTFIATLTGSPDDFGVLQVSDALSIELEAVHIEDEPEWAALLPACIGAILLVDGRHDFHFDDLQPAIDALRTAKKKLPVIVGISHQDEDGAAKPNSVRQFLPENTEDKVFPLVATDRQSAENVLLALIYQILS